MQPQRCSACIRLSLQLPSSSLCNLST